MPNDGANFGGGLALPCLRMLLVPVLTAVLFWPPSAGAAGNSGTAAGAAGESWGETLLEPFGTVSHWVSDLFSHDEHFVSDEIEHFKHQIDSDLGPFDALVREAGFTIASISVGASLVPEISLSLEFQRRLGEGEKTALLAKINDPAGDIGTVERSIIMTLLNAAESGYATRGDGFRLSRVDISLDTVPNVTFVMAPGVMAPGVMAPGVMAPGVMAPGNR